MPDEGGIFIRGAQVNVARQALRHLHDHCAAAVARSQRERLRVEVGRLVLEADVAVFIGRAGAHDGRRIEARRRRGGVL